MRHNRLTLIAGVSALTFAAVCLWLIPRGASGSFAFTPASGVDEGRPASASAAGMAWPTTVSVAGDLRERALRRAAVWRPPQGAPDFSFDLPPAWRLTSSGAIECRFAPRQSSGTTPKFDCALAQGEVVKVKYGRNPEIHAEAAATRLLAAAGFGADHVYLAPRLRCHGCPRFPFQTQRVLELMNADALYRRFASDDGATDFEWVGVERQFGGTPITADGVSGWAWFELEKMSGASRAERDALRLMALLLGHWDNKMENQRLVCLDESAASPDGECRRPFALIQDLGATFGPRKIDLARWRATPIWRDAERCVVSMRDMPWGGGTFTDVQLTEGGRQLIAQQLSGVTHTQLTQLFEGARFGEFERGRWFGPAAPVGAWVTAFEEKVRQIRDAGPCPRTATTAKIAEE